MIRDNKILVKSVVYFTVKGLDFSLTFLSPNLILSNKQVIRKSIASPNHLIIRVIKYPATTASFRDPNGLYW